MILSVSRGGQAFRSESVLEDEKPHQFRGPRRREIPIVAELHIVNRAVVGVAFDADAVWPFGEEPGDPGKR
jgi:hypothetical protein